MIKTIEIKNFKSIDKLKLEIDRFNILIGENGCGKSNILEAIAFGAAASANQLKSEFLTSRGVRTSKPELMRAGFSKANTKKEIHINFKIQKSVDALINNVMNGESPKDIILHGFKNIEYKLQNDNEPYSDWYDVEKVEMTENIPRILLDLFSGKMIAELDEKEKIIEIRKILYELIDKIPGDDIQEILRSKGTKLILEEQYIKDKYDASLSDFTIYSPENNFLRKFEDEEKTQPLGTKGEGLFKLIKVFSEEKNRTSIKEIKQYLKIIDWFEDFEITKKAFGGEKNINLKDRFIDEQLFIQQHNANEGFLFLLFYLSLFISKNTPSFFAVDNIEASFNPKLCSEVIKILNELSKKYNKQVILTTHNPFILDGLDLNDNEQRLFTIKRNVNGETLAKRILPNKSKIKLSEAWMSGFIGGLPKNF
ncbi:MAG: ATP-binding protein [Saprospiraceae bacterium]|nr:ATP-binding protein [Saprospiraceae bacterium]